jgi:hypothetical protein
VIQLFASFALRGLRSHYDILHTDRFGLLEVKLREDNLQNIKPDVLRQRNIFDLAIKQNEAIIHASFAVIQIIAKKSKPFPKDMRMKSAEIFCPEKQQLLEVISLSANTVADRVNGLAEDIQYQLKKRAEFGGIFH